MKKTIIVLLGLTTLVSSASGDLHCALMGRTPSELAAAGSMAYEDVHVDIAKPGLVLIQIKDNYGGGRADQTIEATWDGVGPSTAKNSASERHIAGVMLGSYMKGWASFDVVKGRISMKLGNASYSCENPADIQKDYCSSITTGRVLGL